MKNATAERSLESTKPRQNVKERQGAQEGKKPLRCPLYPVAQTGGACANSAAVATYLPAALSVPSSPRSFTAVLLPLVSPGMPAAGDISETPPIKRFRPPPFYKRSFGHRPYIFIWVVYYAWVVAFTTWWNASPLQTAALNPALRSLLHITILLSSAFWVVALRRENFVRSIKAGAAAVLLGMGFSVIAPYCCASPLWGVMLGTAIGAVNASIIIPFAFILTRKMKLNSKRFCLGDLISFDFS